MGQSRLTNPLFQAGPICALGFTQAHRWFASSLASEFASRDTTGRRLPERRLFVNQKSFAPAGIVSDAAADTQTCFLTGVADSSALTLIGKSFGDGQRLCV